MTPMVFPDDYKGRVKKINEYLMHTLDIIQDKNLKSAMAHYPAAGGKRLRPLLATVASEAVGAKPMPPFHSASHLRWSTTSHWSMTM